jgi:hypothetical protein
MGNEIFISYSRKDIAFVYEILDCLRGRGIDPWFDLEDIPPATPWEEEMLLGVQFCSNFIFIISPDSINSEPCLKELSCAIRHNKRLIPILYRMVNPSLIHPALGELNWIFFDDLELGINRLMQVIHAQKGSLPGLTNRVQACLDIFCGEDSRFDFPLYGDCYWIGRNPMPSSRVARAIILPDPSRFISRFHLELKAEQGKWRIYDRSRNGFYCFPNCPEHLKPNSKVFLGEAAYFVYKELVSQSDDKEPDESPTVT